MQPARGTVIRDVFESECLRGNAPGDPAIREIPVYLPPGYEQSAERYPVIYVLTGFTGRGVMLLNRQGFGPALDERLDRLITAGGMRPSIVVMPDCFTRYGGSQYLDSAATGNYETHITRELVPAIDARYRTLGNRDGRALMGKSSGGYGAMVLGMRHPDLFGALACHSGDMAFEYCYLPDFPATMIELERKGGLEGFLADFDRQPKKSSASLMALNIVAMAACYSPNPATKPHLFDFPFDLATGALRDDVWRRWLALDPVRMIERHEDALRRLTIFLDCGTRDEFRLYASARIFSEALRSRGIRHTFEEFDDTHMDITYRYDRSLRLLSEALTGSR
jgi:enterochelin esterase family protein